MQLGSTYQLVDFGVLERGKASTSSHRPVEQCIDGNTDQSNRVPGVRPPRSGGQDVVDQTEQVVEIADSRILARRVMEVWLGVWDLGSALSATRTIMRKRTAVREARTYLLEHVGKQHVQPRILLDGRLKLL